MSMFDKNISKDKMESLEFAEEQREAEWTLPSFALQLFHGQLDFHLIRPFPTQSPEDKKKGDEYLSKLETFLKENLDDEKKFPLDVHFCKGCNHVQLGEFISPEIMFKNYLYVSGTSDALRKHFEEMVNDISEKIADIMLNLLE